MSMENIQVQEKCVNAIFMFLMLSESGQIEKPWISLKKKKRRVHSFCTAPSHRWQMSQKLTKKFQKQKYISCTQNVQPMFMTEKNTSLYTAKHTT